MPRPTTPWSGSGYPDFISRDWDYGYRAARIVQMIEATPKLSLQDIQAIQGDDFDAGAAITLPYLSKLQFDDPVVSQALASLMSWDQQDRLDSGPAAVFNLFWRQLILQTFSDELPDGPLPDGSRAFTIFTSLLATPKSPWWDDHTTDAVETRDEILRSAFTQAINDGKSLMGSDPASWRWGDLHTATFRNQSLGESGVPPIEVLLNRGPFAVSGGTSIVNATAWKVDEGFEVSSLPSMRIINDLAHWDDTVWIHTTGESGHAFNPHNIDQTDAWRQIEYLPMTWSETAVVSAAADHLSLNPVSRYQPWRRSDEGMNDLTIRPTPDRHLERLSLQAEALRGELDAFVRAQHVEAPQNILTSLTQMSHLLRGIQGEVARGEQQRGNLLALAEISRMVNSSLDLQTVLREVMDTIIRLTGADRGFLMLKDETGELQTARRHAIGSGPP